MYIRKWKQNKLFYFFTENIQKIETPSVKMKILMLAMFTKSTLIVFLSIWFILSN